MLSLWAYVRYAEGRRKNAAVQNADPAPRSGLKAPRSTLHASRTAGHAPRYYLLSLLFFACGLMSKPMVVTLPFTLLLLDYWPLGRMQKAEGRMQNAATATPLHAPRSTPSLRLLAEKLPFFLAAALSSGITFAVQKHGGAVIATLPVAGRLSNAVVSYCRYLGKLFWPVDLAALYPGVEHWRVPIVAAAALLLLGISAAAIALRRAHP